MSKNTRDIIGVVGAEVNSIEQREILKGVIKQAMTYNMNTAVITNTFNSNVVDNDLYCENNIYDLIASEDLSAIIMISESFVNEHLREKIKHYLLKKDIPIIILGTRMPEFNLPGIKTINTSDENDIMDITNHLIEEHGFTDIDILTGYDFVEASNLRVDGYRKALESHGIEYVPSKVHYGDFWMNSGEELAKKYIKGELPMPQAVVCANDYMAYGILSEFEREGLNIPETIAVIGYEFIRERHIHSPILTTYQRNRQELGIQAVKIIYNKLNMKEEEVFVPPKGRLIYGTSCKCPYEKIDIVNELIDARTKKKYHDWNFYNFMEQHLTVCNNLESFIEVMGKYQYLVRDARDIFLCLNENWYDSSKEIESSNITCRNVMPWMDNSPFTINKYDIAEAFSGLDYPAVCYFNPLFFKDNFFGHIILRYDKPDIYDDVFRNWIKSVSGGLEFLCRKNDIQYLMQCQNLFADHDTMTDMYNESGLAKTYASMTQDRGEDDLYAVMLSVCIGDKNDFSDEFKKKKIASIINVSKVIKQFAEKNGIYGRVSDNSFLCFIAAENIPENIILSKLGVLLMSVPDYLKDFGMDSFFTAIEKVGKGSSYENISGTCRDKINTQIIEGSKRKLKPYYNELLKIRNEIYTNPDEKHSIDEFGKKYFLSTNYIRKIYKNCFGVSVHKDCIYSRIILAAFYLISTNMSIASISEKCGYDDSKYFMRQFVSLIGYTPNHYRKIMAL